MLGLDVKSVLGRTLLSDGSGSHATAVDSAMCGGTCRRQNHRDGMPRVAEMTTFERPDRAGGFRALSILVSEPSPQPVRLTSVCFT